MPNPRRPAPGKNTVAARDGGAAPRATARLDGLRARKKQATRQAISDVATRLFIERGFDNVTIAEIAEAAHVAKMTVTNYFPRKEDLFFDRRSEGGILLREALAASSGGAPVARVRNLARHMLETRHPLARLDAGVARFWQAVAASQTLRACAREMQDDLTREFTGMLANAAGRPADDPQALLAASLIVSSWQTAYVAGLQRLRDRGGAVVARATFNDLLERGFRAARAALQGTPYI